MLELVKMVVILVLKMKEAPLHIEQLDLHACVNQHCVSFFVQKKNECLFLA